MPKNDDLIKKAEQMTREGKNRITAGAPGENALSKEMHGNVLITQMPRDPDALRVSVGAPHDADQSYLVFRGDRYKVLKLLEKSIEALKQSLRSSNG